MRSRLREQFATTLPRFDLLSQLERHPEGLKMNELSRLLMVTGGNVTAIVDQLEKEGLVERLEELEDRRAFRIRLTRGGVKSFTEMARAHEQWVVELLAGLSRKSTIGHLTGRPVEERLAGSLAVALLALERGARILRVHDVKETRDVIRVWQAFHGA